MQRKLETNFELRVWARDEAFGIVCMVVLWLTWGREGEYEISEGGKRQRIEILERRLNLGIIKRKRRQKESVTKG